MDLSTTDATDEGFNQRASSTCVITAFEVEHVAMRTGKTMWGCPKTENDGFAMFDACGGRIWGY